MPEFPIKVFTADRFQLVHNEQEYQALLEQFTYIRAAGGLVFNDANELLMIVRRGKWDLPKGKVEAGEDVVTAALREVFPSVAACDYPVLWEQMFGVISFDDYRELVKNLND